MKKYSLYVNGELKWYPTNREGVMVGVKIALGALEKELIKHPKSQGSIFITVRNEDDSTDIDDSSFVPIGVHNAEWISEEIQEVVKDNDNNNSFAYVRS